MTFPRPTSDTVAAIRAFLADPRFASASTLAAVGMAVSAQLIQNLIGWAGLVAILITLVVLMSGSVSYTHLDVYKRQGRGRSEQRRDGRGGAPGVVARRIGDA